MAPAPFHPAPLTLRFGEHRAVEGGPRPGISSLGETQVTLQRPPAAVYHEALRLPPLSAACLGLVHFVSCCYCRRRSRASRAGAAPYPETPAAPGQPPCQGVLEEPLISPPAYMASSCVLRAGGVGRRVEMQGAGAGSERRDRGSQLDGGASARLASLPALCLEIQTVAQRFLGSNGANYNAAGPAASACCLWCRRDKGINLACSIVNGTLPAACCHPAPSLPAGT